MAIIGAFPSNIKNGDPVDATVVMNLFAYIQSQTNNNACPATTGSTVLKGNGSGGTTSAIPGSDFLAVSPGMLFDYAGSTIPSGYLLCDGSAVNRTTYANLFNAIGTTWGAGDGSTTFNLPDFRGRATFGAGTGTGLTARTLGGVIGAETSAIAVANLPAHNHTVTVTDPGHNHTVTNGAHSHNIIPGGGTARVLRPDVAGGGNFGGGTGSTSDLTATDNAASNVSLAAATTGITATTANTGSGTALNVVNPGAVVNKIIKT